MNKHIHRLVFDRRRGMRVPAAEHARSAGKAASGQTRGTAVALAVSVLMASGAAQGGSVSASAGVNVSSVSAGGAAHRASASANPARALSASRSVADMVSQVLASGRPNLPVFSEAFRSDNRGLFDDPGLSPDGTVMTLLQKSGAIIVNWDSFNIGKGYTVEFKQPDGGRALNKVRGGDASLIDGVLKGNGEVMVENGAGIIFGRNARVNVGSLVATALSVAKDAEGNFDQPNDPNTLNLYNKRRGEAVFGGADANTAGFVATQPGAVIQAAAGGKVLMVAPRVVNQGVIETPGGQTVLAAGQTVYLFAPTDQAQRGLIVAVDNFSDDTLKQIEAQVREDKGLSSQDALLADHMPLGTVENERVGGAYTSGLIRADKGTINLVGAAIRQKGQLTATTAVKGQNGAIFITAMKDTGVSAGDGHRTAKTLGTVELGAGSITEVLPSTEGLTSLDGSEVVAQRVQAVVEGDGVASITLRQIGVLPSEQVRVAAVIEEPKRPTVPAEDASPEVKAQYQQDLAQFEQDKAAFDAAELSVQRSSDVYYRSRIDVIGSDIAIRRDARVQAPAGEINILASDDWQSSALRSSSNGQSIKDQSRVVMEAGAVVDASGLDNLRLPSQRRQLKAQLFSAELADSPVQRSGVVYRQTVRADARVALSLGDVSGYYSNLRYSAAELSTSGGLVRMQSQGALLLDAGSKVDFSGGSVIYDKGELTNSVLIRNGLLSLVSGASKDLIYSAFLSDPGKTSDEDLARFGLLGKVPSAAVEMPEQFVGQSAGVAVLAAPTQHIGAQLDGSVRMSEVQRNATREAGRDPGLSVSLQPKDQDSPVWKGLNDLSAADRLVRLSQVLTKDVTDQTWADYQPHLFTSLRPTAGWLVIGREVGSESAQRSADNLVQGVRITAEPSRSLGVSAGQSGQAWQDLLAQVGDTTVLSAEQLNAAGLGSLTVFANQIQMGDSITGDAPVLNLTAGGSVLLKAREGDVALQGKVNAQGGRIEVLAQGGDLVLHTGSALNAAGTQRDDRHDRGNITAGAARGGEVSLKASGSVVLQSDSEIDVSGAAWRQLDGGLVKGAAGRVTLKANDGTAGAGATMPTGSVYLNGTLSAFDMGQGGQLAIQGLPSVVLGTPAQMTSGKFLLSSSLYADRGFGSLSVESLGHVTVHGDAQVRPALVSLVALPSAVSALTGQTAREATLPEGQRSGLSLSLSASTQPNVIVQNGLPTGADLSVAEGALIDMGLGGRLSLSAGGSIDMAGTLRALGGDVSLSLLGARGATSASDAEQYGYLAGQSIHLHNGSLIDVSGAVKAMPQPSALSRALGLPAPLMGEVLAGGTVTLGGAADASVRGQLLMDEGATIRLNGAQALLSSGGTGLSTLRSAAAGTLTIQSTDGFSLLGIIEAAAPNSSVAGGTLKVSLSQQGKLDLVAPGGLAYPQGADAGSRSISIAANQTEAKALAAQRLFGEGVLGAHWINSSGFDRIQLQADESIRLHEGTQLRADAGRTRLQSVVLDAPVLDLMARSTPSTALVQADHVIQAHHVAMGPTTRLNSSLTPAVPASQRSLTGDERLRVQAGLIEISGDTAVQGAGTIDLDATLSRDPGASDGRTNGEIRFIGQRPMSADLGADRSLRGTFTFQGDLNLTAGVVYATTMSHYTLQGAEGSRLTVSAPLGGSSSQTPLSALASLTIQASDVTLDGVLHQPVGSLSVTADRLTVTDRARLANTAEGVTVPVGYLINNSQWLYSPQGALSTGNVPAADNVVQDITKLPINKQIVLNGQTLSIGQSSVLQAQAGGDITGWQFNPGVGGSTDTYLRPGLFAVLPTYRFDFAPYDADIRARTQQIGTDLKVGDQVVITSANGVLAPGAYTLLDARYGILPGAVLLSEGQLNLSDALSTGARQDDGSVVVSGFRHATGTAQTGGNDVRQAWTIEPSSTYRAKSDVTVVSGNEFQNTRARRSGEALARPGDGGVASLKSENAFDWMARFNFQGADKLRAGGFDLAMPDIVVQRNSTASTSTPSGLVSAQALEALGAESIVLGGVRTAQSDGRVSIERVAKTVTVSADGTEPGGSTLNLSGELLMVAQQSLTVDAGVGISVQAADDGLARSYVAQRDGAQVLVSHRGATDVASANTTGDRSAVLTLGAGASEAAVRLSGAAIQLDSTGRTELSERTQLDARALGLGAAAMLLGDADLTALPEGVLPSDTLRIQGDLLTRLNQAQRLTLRANAGSLALAAGTQLGQASTEQITLNAPQLLGVPAAASSSGGGDVVRVTARQISLRNSTGQAVSDIAAAAGQGVIELSAQPVLKDGRTGGIQVEASGAAGQHWGFAETRLSSRGDIVFTGAGRTQAAGDVQLSAARVTAAGSADQTLQASGDLRIAHANGARTLNESLGAGGRLALEGGSLTQSGNIDIEAGRLTLTATSQDLVLAEGSTTRVDGRLRQVSDTFAVASGGGQIVAQARQGHLVVNGLLSATAPTLGAGVSGQTPEAGRIELKATAAGAQVRLGEAARLDVSGASGRHGEVAVDATALTLGAASQALAAQAAEGGAAARSALDQLVAISRPADGTTLRAFEVRQRAGDLSLNAQLKAARVALSTDTGSLTLNSDARIEATTASGGVVQLQAGQDLVLNDDARIEARSTREGANGGDVLLSAKTGSVRLGAATVVADSVNDAQDGRILVRARQTQNAQGQFAGMKLEAMEGSNNATLQAGRVHLEGVRVYDSASLKTLGTGAASASNLNLNALVTAATSYASVANETAVLNRAGLTGTPNVSLRSGVEIQAQGDFTVSQDLQVAAAARPMNLTVRAAGNLNINGSVSAGFNNALTTGTIQAGEASSLRFVAGADLQAADVHATQGRPEAGHVTLASNKLVRTTTGSIDVHAAGDVRMMASSLTQPSAIYVTGGLSSLADNELLAVANTTQAKGAASRAYEQGASAAVFTERGERLTVHAGGRVGSFASVTTGSDGRTTYVARQLTQGSGNYFLHGGTPNAPVLSQQTPVAWFTRFGDFRQGLGSFGGGNIHVQAGDSVSDLAVVAPTNGRQVLTLDAQGTVLSSQLKVLNGGDVSVVSGGDIAGGLYFLGRGTGRIQAAGGLVSGGDDLADGVTPPDDVVADPDALLAVMDGQWAVNTVDDLRISHAYNPTAIPFLSVATGTIGLINTRAAVFFTYGADAGVTLSSLRGQVSVSPDNQNFELMHSITSPTSKLSGPVARDATYLASVLPPVFKAVSLGGDVLIDTSGKWTTGTPSNGVNGSALFVMPTRASDVTVYAAQDFHLQGNLQLPDTSAWGAGLPSVDSPVNFNGIGSGTMNLGGLADLLISSFTTAGGNPSLSTNVRSNTGTEGTVVGAVHGDVGQANNPSSVRLVAGRDVSFDDVIASRNNVNRTVFSYLRTNRPTEIVAGRDINNPHFVGQNFDADDVTRLSAGRDINGIGVTNNNNARVIALSGPGALKIEAGRDLNLRQMAGVLAYGNQINSGLPAQSAKITVAAGQAQAVNLSELLSRHGQRPGLRQALTQALVDSGLPPSGAVAGAGDWNELTDAQLQAAFAELNADRQVLAVQAFLDAEFAAQFLPEDAGQSASYYRSEAFQHKKQEAMWRQIRESAAAAGAIAVSTDEAEEARRKERRTALFAQAAAVADLAGLGATFERAGDISLGQSRVHNLGQGGGDALGSANDALGGIDVIAAGQVLAGLPTSVNAPGGFISYGGGSFRSISGGDFLAGDQRVIAMGRGNLLIYSVAGSIDSGKGSNTATSTTLPLRRFNTRSGQVEVVGQPPVSGSGFQKIDTPKDMVPVVGLYAPNGEIRALDAFIKGDAAIDIVAPTVIGADNIGGAAGIAPPPAPTVSLSLTPQVTDTAAGTQQVASATEAKAEQRANSVLTVDLLGYGDAPAAGAATDTADAPEKAKGKEQDQESSGTGTTTQKPTQR
jgi:filamentous hemagglutinin family protein